MTPTTPVKAHKGFRALMAMKGGTKRQQDIARLGGYTLLKSRGTNYFRRLGSKGGNAPHVARGTNPVK